MIPCYDCGMAARYAWDSYSANCRGCMDRALAGLKTLPPLEPAAEKGKETPCSD
jgi:hypothetical protein